MGNIEKALRNAMKRCGLSVYAIAKGSGVPLTCVQQFAAGRGLRLATADRLADYFGLELRPKRGRQAR
ncbi:MAG: hypothetical protein L6Q92_08145 [Phycisphaerae bacterium]|nr:hypothetical protein [Phycisphaerae bacterium]